MLGTLLHACTGIALSLTGGLIEAANGGQVNMDSSATSPLITLHGGSHILGGSAIGVSSGGQFTGGSAGAPLIALDNAQLTGAGSVLREGGGGGDGGGDGASGGRRRAQEKAPLGRDQKSAGGLLT